ncbi:hypothetical protein FA95DRAFT_1608509 [Auriscalpium vulgare]|uniref:Uncharacterized protein n=1 Tax=Auriscalpium vulgare TaxID=40419 RepID=A0ACB8RLR8_9AGAM|nr:hypothetical protein FA95DRAFT_1608509 [Auriscalpium vulgare]
MGSRITLGMAAKSASFQIATQPAPATLKEHAQVLQGLKKLVKRARFPQSGPTVLRPFLAPDSSCQHAHGQGILRAPAHPLHRPGTQLEFPSFSRNVLPIRIAAYIQPPQTPDAPRFSVPVECPLTLKIFLVCSRAYQVCFSCVGRAPALGTAFFSLMETTPIPTLHILHAHQLRDCGELSGIDTAPGARRRTVANAGKERVRTCHVTEGAWATVEDAREAQLPPAS